MRTGGAIPLDEWPWLLVGGLLFFLVVEAEKLFIRRTRQWRAEERRVTDPVG